LALVGVFVTWRSELSLYVGGVTNRSNHMASVDIVNSCLVSRAKEYGGDLVIQAIHPYYAGVLFMPY